MITWYDRGRMCNTNFRGLKMYTATEGEPYLRLNFRTDYATNRTGFAGVSYLKCGGELKGPSGEISMMNLLEMDLHTFCMYNITVRPGRTIKFEFDAFNIPSDNNCYSFISFKNGHDDTAPLLGQGKYCGTEIPDIPLTTSRYAFVRFFTTTQSTFFKLRYKEVGAECGETIRLTHQSNSSLISSPNFPNMPNPHSECIWHVMAPAGEAITIAFTKRFDLIRTPDCAMEYLELREGGTEKSQIIDRFCGRKPPAEVKTKSNRLRIKYFTDVIEPNNGFQAEVKIASCGGTYQALDGIISSPGFGSPGAYPSNMECDFRILGPSGTSIQLNFKSFHLPLDNPDGNCTDVDHVSVYSVVPNENDTLSNQNTLDLLGQFCGTILPPNRIQGSSNEMIVRFKTFDGNVMFKGFQFRYNISQERCREEINAESGVITSPGYPNRIGLNRFCEWKITVPAGRRVTAKIVDLDLDITNGPYSQRLIFYHDSGTRIRIKTITGADTPQTISSSGNKMLITSWIRFPSSNRGFKIEFNSDERTVCDGDLNMESGTIYAPTNISSYMCEYTRDRPINSTYQNIGTLALEFKDVKAGIRSMPDCRFLTSKIMVQWKNAPNEQDSYFAKLCGIDIPDTRIYSPFYDTIVSARQSLYGGMTNFTLNYWTFNCGGVMRESGSIQQPTFTNPPGTFISCAWHISHPSDVVTMHIRVNKLKMTQDCDKEYVQLYNGPTSLSPHLVRYCGKELPSGTLNTQSQYVYMFYYSERYNPATEFQIDIIPTAAACGGVIHMPVKTISSPGNGSYFNNMECIWEIRADPGYTVDLWFTDRFYIEDTVGCEKDYVEISKSIGVDEWESLGKFCGRHLPPIFNTTSSRMKVKFRTDQSNVGDGFTVEWAQKCGGIFTVTDAVQTMISPKYPKNYDPNLKCNYTFVSTPPNNYINLIFKDFILEETSRRCIYDNLTIYKYNEFQFGNIYEKMNTYCRQNSPGHVRVRNRAVVLFQSDQFHERTGFRFEYHLDKCGTEINSSTVLQSPSYSENGELPTGLDCVWKITAPPLQNIVIRFENIELERSDTCWFDYVAVYRSHNMSETNRVAKLCGKFTDRTIDLGGTEGTIQLKTDTSNNKGSFRARVIMTPKCSRTISIPQNDPNFNLKFTQGDFVPNKDCHHLIKTDVGRIFKGHFKSFHVPQCGNTTNTNNTECPCDVLEVRDGAGPFAELIGRYCGHEIPQDFQTSSHLLWIRFATGNSNQTSSGIELELTSIASICGPPLINVSKIETFTLRPPMNNGNYQKNLHCNWQIEGPLATSFEIKVDKLNIEDPDDSGACSNDYLKITDDNVKDFLHDSTFEDNIVYNGQGHQGNEISFYSGMYRPSAPHIFCGNYDNGHQISYFTSVNKVYVKFVSNSEIEKTGFELTFRPSGGCHDYNGLQGRISGLRVQNCIFYIRVPQNHTISIYYNNIYFYDDNCTKSGMQIFDGEFATVPSVSACSFVQPNPFFSTSNVVKIQVNALHEYSGTYDIYYVATDKGRGCGGTLFNYGGIFTSPLYPENTRNESDCRWTMHVPRNMKIALRFTIFDLGAKSTCKGNYVQIIETDNAGEDEVKRQYCGEDDPALYRSESSIVTVRLKTTRNFAGTGFIANYIAAFEDTKVQNW